MRGERSDAVIEVERRVRGVDDGAWRVTGVSIALLRKNEGTNAGASYERVDPLESEELLDVPDIVNMLRQNKKEIQWRGEK